MKFYHKVLALSFCLLFCQLLGAEPVPAEIDVKAPQESPIKEQIQRKSTAFENCGLNLKSRELAELVINDEAQLRPVLICDPLLAKVAAQKAQEMAKEGKVSHYGPGGNPHQRLLKAGYPLVTYDDSDNNVEAVQGGYSDPDDVLMNFSTSYGHRVHLYAEHEFYLKQTKIGVGYARDIKSPHVDYWAVYIAE